MHRPLSVVLVGLGKTEIDEDAISDVSSNVTIEILNHFTASLLVCPKDIA